MKRRFHVIELKRNGEATATANTTHLTDELNAAIDVAVRQGADVHFLAASPTPDGRLLVFLRELDPATKGRRG